MLYLDTSVLVPLFLPEADSDRLQRWIERQDSGGCAISEWTLTELRVPWAQGAIEAAQPEQLSTPASFWQAVAKAF